MSSNITLISPTEDKIQDKDMAHNKVLSLDNQGLLRKLKQRKYILRKDIYHYTVQMIKKWQDKNQKT